METPDEGSQWKVSEYMKGEAVTVRIPTGWQLTRLRAAAHLEELETTNPSGVKTRFSIDVSTRHMNKITVATDEEVTGPDRNTYLDLVFTCAYNLALEYWEK